MDKPQTQIDRNPQETYGRMEAARNMELLLNALAEETATEIRRTIKQAKKGRLTQELALATV